MRKYKPVNVNVTISTRGGKSLSLAYGKYDEFESNVLVVGRNTPTSLDIRRKVDGYSNKATAALASQAIQVTVILSVGS